MYRCNKCRDMLFILKDDKAYPCECRDKKIAEEMLEKSGISEEFRKRTFENFDYRIDYKILEAYTRAVTYANEFEEKKDSILFMGQSGFGKSHLTMAIANRLLNKGISVIYMPYRDVITEIKQNILDPEYYKKMLSRYQRAKVLLIDDLFKGNISKSDINIMFEIVNYRYLNHLPMIISTEYNVNSLLDIDEAIGSRMIEMSKDNIVQVKGKRLNYRIYKGN